MPFPTPIYQGNLWLIDSGNSQAYQVTGDGLVTRIADPSDGRVSRIYLTDHGRSLRDELVPKAVAVNAATLGSLSPSEGRTLRRLLVKLLDATGDSTPLV